IQLDAIPDERFGGTVNRIVPTVDRTKATVLVKIRFDERDERVLPDMSAKVAFLERPLRADERQPVVAVPAGTVLSDEHGTAVLRIREGRAQRVAVQTGNKLGDLVQVSGVEPGQRLVAQPLDAALDGRKVTVAQKP